MSRSVFRLGLLFLAVSSGTATTLGSSATSTDKGTTAGSTVTPAGRKNKVTPGASEFPRQSAVLLPPTTSPPAMKYENVHFSLNVLYSDVLICANMRTKNGTFQFEKCPRHPNSNLFPFCIYMIVPGNKTHRGYDKYGCVYIQHLPKQCIEREQHYFEYITIPFRGVNHTGSALCCMDNYCNQLEDPLFASVRLKEDRRHSSVFSWPLLIAIVIVVAGMAPAVITYLDTRHEKNMRKSENAGFMDESIGVVGHRRIKEVQDIHSQSMNFPSLKQMQQAVKETLQSYKYGYHTQSQSLNNWHQPPNASSSVPNPADEDLDEGHAREPRELLISDHCMVFQRDDKNPCKIKRNVPSKYEHLAQRMIEHGPYRYDFDAVELGYLFDSVSNIFANEPSLLELRGDTYIYGNLEGSYGDLFRWFHKNGWPPAKRVLFLGGLTHDDEPYSLETIALIFALKKIMPGHVFVLRGAAEVYPMKMEDGRFPRRISRCLQDVITRTCAYLPLAATIGPVFCSHGGFPGSVRELEEVSSIRRPIFNVEKGTVAAKLIFSQAGPNEGQIPGCRGTGFSNQTQPDLQCPWTGQTFSLYVRARNSSTNGYMFIGDSILSLWSAPGYPSENQGGASLFIDSEMNATVNKMAKFGYYPEEVLRKHDEERKKESDKQKDRKMNVKRSSGKRKRKAASSVTKSEKEKKKKT